MSSLLTKISIIYTQLVQEKNIFSIFAQIRVTGRMEPEICTKMLKKLSEKRRPKFPATTPGCSILKSACLDDAFLEVFQPKASLVEGQSLQQKEKKRRKRKGEKKKLKNRKA